MKTTYPIVIEDTGGKYLLVTVPDFDRMTQGEDITEAIDMAEDLIGILGNDLEDKGQKLPVASSFEKIQKEFPQAIVTLVNVDFDEYRRMNLKRLRKIVLFQGG